LIKSITLAAFDRKIDGLCHAASDTVKVGAEREVVQLHLLLICRRYQISVPVQQLKIDRLIAMVLIYLRIESRSPQIKLNRHKTRAGI
jgi:hypothetical protein